MRNKIDPQSSNDIKIEKNLFRWHIYDAYYEFSSSDSVFSSGGWYRWNRVTIIGYKNKEDAISAAKKIDTMCNQKYIFTGIVLIILGWFFILITKNNSIFVSLFFSIPIFIIGVYTIIRGIPISKKLKTNTHKTKEKYIYTNGSWKIINE